MGERIQFGPDVGLRLSQPAEAGFTPLGRFIDRQYLNGIGWRGIRVRRQLLERVVRDAIEQTHAKKGSVHVVDIAAGAGRYLLETLKRCESLRSPRNCATWSRRISKKARRSPVHSGCRT